MNRARLSFRARSPIRVRSLAIFLLPLRVADVCPSTSENCEGLHSTGITQLLRYPAFIPDHFRFCAPPFQCWSAYSTLFSSMPRLSGQPGSFTFTMCCSMLSETPEGEPSLVISVMALVACVHLQRIGPLEFVIFRGLLPDSASYASPRNLCSTPCSPLTLRSRVSGLTLSIVSRVPSYSVNSRYALRRTYGMTDYFFPRGVPSLLNVNPFQVYEDYDYSC